MLVNSHTMTMTFDDIHRDSECNCVNDAAENTQDFFARRVFNETFDDADFETYWESGKRPQKEGCREFCDYKSVSIFKVNAREQPELIEGIEKQMARTASLSPGRVMPTIFLKFTCSSGAGVIKPSPIHRQLPGAAHHSLFKCDAFTLEHIQPAEFVQLNVA